MADCCFRNFHYTVTTRIAAIAYNAKAVTVFVVWHGRILSNRRESLRCVRYFSCNTMLHWYHRNLHNELMGESFTLRFLKLNSEVDGWFLCPYSAAAIVIFFFTTQTPILTRCILYKIKDMNLRNMNIGDANAVKLKKNSERTPYVPW